MADPYYQDDFVTIYHGEALNVLPTLTAADVVILDPPYSMTPNAVRGRDDGAAGTSGAPIMLLTESLGHAHRLLSAGGVAAIICDWRRIPDVSYLAVLKGFRLATCIAWTRNRPGTGGLFRSAWDPILVMSVGTADAVDRAAIPNTINLDYPAVRAHPYEKPVGLWAHITQRVPEGVVVDPFMGVGSSMVDALATRHRYVGIEVDERYCELAVARLAQGSLFGV